MELAHLICLIGIHRWGDHGNYVFFSTTTQTLNQV